MTESLLLDLVKEIGVVDIIMDYKNQLEISDKYKKCLDELKLGSSKLSFIMRLVKNRGFGRTSISDSLSDFFDLPCNYHVIFIGKRKNKLCYKVRIWGFFIISYEINIPLDGGNLLKTSNELGRKRTEPKNPEPRKKGRGEKRKRRSKTRNYESIAKRSHRKERK